MRFDTAKYRPFGRVALHNRTWPDHVIEQAPIWCSVDLRDGNQALVTPMNLEQKIELFKLLLKIGFKDIEVGFPSASQVEFDFLRTLVEQHLIPDDVRIQVLVQAREHLIERTFEALRGVKKAIVHLYNSTSTAQRKIVFKKEQKEIIDIALAGVDLIKKFESTTDTQIFLEYSPESFTGTELEFARDICNAVTARWGISAARPVILNLPATVEMATPNTYADMVEWMGRELHHREHVLISTHTHNDRGTSVAATELALMAGADRVEGTLLANGERTGNVDIITLALNMSTQGVESHLDFSNVDHVISVVERVTNIATHVRHPYVGKLVYTAFSGSHQDAIKKGMAYQKERTDGIWEVPYLPIDPSDVGRTYEDIIRINSQSGKGGVAYILEEDFGYILPKAMHPEVGALVQDATDKSGKEITKEGILSIFEAHYFRPNPVLKFKKFEVTSRIEEEGEITVLLAFEYKTNLHTASGSGNGPIDACKNALTQIYRDDFSINSFSEHSRGKSSSAQAIAYIEVENAKGETLFGVGRDNNTTIASVKALFCALNLMFETL
ncbi:MAG: 2-isopropylmalate synthase [Sulfuricurvum sp. PC08-66]|nr:MAG: 2-isopropylmalate synthase [Sulfuricurvum sp. PC08-66]